MNIHSAMPAAAGARRARPEPVPGPKRDAILRAAITVFASHGYFNSQVADVAREAGVAAGTVYLYFRSKDDLLVSIFEHGMRASLAEGRALAGEHTDPAERLRRFARAHLERLGRDRNLAIVFQVELRQSTKFMERFSASLVRDYLGLIREAFAEGQRAGVFRANVNPTVAAKVFFGALDEMATNWVLSKRHYTPESDADAIVDLFLNGARRQPSSDRPRS
jgi:TetR/AcrR family fatty acid metabolism transcriptional regulator